MEKAKIIKHFPLVKRFGGGREINLYCGKYKDRIITVAEIFEPNKLLPDYRIFMDVKRKEYFSEDLRGTTKQRYTTIDIQSMVGWRCEIKPMYGREETVKAISKHMFGSENVIKAILHFQKKVHDKKLEADRKEEWLTICRMRAVTEKEPGNFYKWMRQMIEPERLAFVNKEDSYAVCECGKIIEKGIGGHEGHCPSCGKIKYRHLRKGDHCQVRTTNYAYLMQPYQNGYVVRTYSLTKSYGRENRVKFRTMEEKRTFYLPGEIKSYEKRYDYELNRWKWEKERYRTGDADGGRLYPYNLGSTKNGMFQYAVLDIYAKGHVKLNAYLQNYLEHSVVESYVKLGLTNLLNDRLPYIEGISIKKSTGLNSAELRFFRKYNIGRQGKNLFDALKKDNIRTSEEEFLFLMETEAHERTLVKLLKQTTAKRLIRYLKQEKRSFKWSTLIGRYADYLDMAAELHYNLQDDFVRFPKNIGQAHDIATDALNEQRAIEMEKKRKAKNRKNDQNIKKMAELRNQLYAFESKNYIIRIPETSLEIIKEGQDQHHCVATYVDRVASGTTTILFLRNKKEPEKAFYTIEAQHGKVIQYRTKYNGAMTEAVKNFMEQYKAVIKERWEEHERNIPSDDTRRVG